MEITDLEAVSLGQILKFQPCTAHLVRNSFDGSLSKQFSDSSGSVYPMLKRLEKRALVRSEIQVEGKRKVRYYRCTAEGRGALRRWLGPPIMADAAVTFDPLRTRMIFLKNLSVGRRTQWIKAAAKTLQATLNAIEIRIAESNVNDLDNLFDRLANENARISIKGRMEWLQSAKKRLENAGLIEPGAGG